MTLPPIPSSKLSQLNSPAASESSTPAAEVSKSKKCFENNQPIQDHRPALNSSGLSAVVYLPSDHIDDELSPFPAAKQAGPIASSTLPSDAGLLTPVSPASNQPPKSSNPAAPANPSTSAPVPSSAHPIEILSHALSGVIMPSSKLSALMPTAPALTVAIPHPNPQPAPTGRARGGVRQPGQDCSIQ